MGKRIETTGLAALTLLALWGCHRGPLATPPAAADAGTGTGTGTGDVRAVLKLSPLPEPPKLDLAPEILPGADGALAVVAAQPQGAAPGRVRPTITFSKPVMALSSVADAAKRPPVAAIAPPLPGTWRWLGSSSVELEPQGLVPMATSFQVTVPAGLKALDGSTLKAPYTFTFHTAAPRLVKVDPAVDLDDRLHRGSLWLTPQSTFALTFNQPVRDLLAHATLTANGAKIPLTLVRTVGLADARRANEAGRRFARQSFADKGVKDRATRYELKPSRPLPRDASVALAVDASLAGEDGPLTLGASQGAAFHTYGPMAFHQALACTDFYKCPYGPVVLVASNAPDLDSLKAHLRVTPAVKIDWAHARVYAADDHARAQKVVLSGAWRPGTAYTLTVAAGVLDVFKQAAPAFSGEVHTSDADPEVNLGPDTALLEAGGDGALPVHSVNVPEVSAQIYPLTPDRVARLLTASWRHLDAEAGHPSPALKIVAGVKPVARTLKLPHTPNRGAWTPLPLRDVLQAAHTTLFLVEAHTGSLSKDQQPSGVLGQLTDLAVHAKLGATRSLAWVTSLSKGTPVPGARVSLFDGNGKVVWTGVTDAQGLADLPGLEVAMPSGPKNRYGMVPFAMVSAEKDGDLGVTATGWEGSASAWAFGITPDWEPAKPGSLSQVFTERGVYRPGDTVDVKGALRSRALGQIRNPGAGIAVQLTVRDAKGNAVAKATATTSAFGGFSARLALPADGPLGAYDVTAVGRDGTTPISASATFQVAAYRAPQFQVDVTAPRSSVLAGEPLTAHVLSRYLFGGAMAGAPVHWTAVRHTAEFAPPNNPGFDFGPHTWWWNDDAPQPSSAVVGGGDATSDAQGNVVLELGRAAAPGNQTYTVTVEAETTDVSRQRVANRATLTVHPAAVYPGIGAPSGFGTVGQALPVSLVAVDPAGARRAGQAVALTVKRREWRSIKKKGVGGAWFTETEPVETPVSRCQVRTQAAPVACTFTPDKPGLYLLEATATDPQGRTAVARSSTYVVGPGWVSWQRGDTDRIDLVADKASYQVGDTAHVLVKSPYPEADAVLTVEREGVLSRRVVHLSGAATALDVPITAALVPNAYVGLVLVRGRVPSASGVEVGADPGRPATRFGYVALKVETKTKRLTVTLTPAKADARPGESVDVAIKTTDWKGQPVHAEVALWAVDEGVLRLTDYQPPDPVAAMHPPQGLAVRIAEPLVNLVQKQLYGEKGETAGGGGGDDATGAGIRSHFQTTAAFLPNLVTDARGAAHATIKLPDNLTTYRLMAVAWDALDSGGVGASKITVSKALLALPALPRLARVGDVFEAGVVVHTHGAVIPEATVTAHVTGATLDGPAKQEVSLADGEGHEVRFRFRAERAGTATFTFAVEGGGERDAVQEKIPIELPVSMEAVAVAGDTEGQAVEGLVPPAGVRPGVGGLTVTLASSVLGGFGEAMGQLIDYPYGCAEQLSSRLVPFIALRELYGKFGGAWPTTADDRARQMQRQQWLARWLGGDSQKVFGVSDPDEVVKLTLAKLLALQNPGGGFRLWPAEGCAEDDVSSYAVLALGRAKEVGYPVSAKALEAGQAYVKRVATGACNPCDAVCAPPTPSERVFALYALARTGAPQPSSYADLFARRASLPLASQAMLADAMFVGRGDRAQAHALLTELLNHAQQTAREVTFTESNLGSGAPRWSSDARTDAIALQTLTDLSPGHPFVAKLAHHLARARQSNGRFRNTQEAAFSLMALAEVVRTKERAVPDFTAKVALGGAPLASATFHGRDTALVTQDVPLSALGPVGTSRSFTFGKQGPGVLYYGALLRYAPAALPTTPLDRGMVVQRWFEPYAGGGQATAFAAGELVRVRVRVATSQPRRDVAVTVPLPAGLEAVDTSMASTAQLPQAAGDEGPADGYRYDSDEDQDGATTDDAPTPRWANQFWSPFNFVEKRDDQVVLFADALPPGVHVTSFVARATTPGTFISAPAEAQEMYAPEVFGRSGGGRLQVVSPDAVARK